MVSQRAKTLFICQKIKEFKVSRHNEATEGVTAVE